MLSAMPTIAPAISAMKIFVVRPIFFFLFYVIHLFTPVCRWDMYSLSASCQSGI